LCFFANYCPIGQEGPKSGLVFGPYPLGPIGRNTEGTQNQPKQTSILNFRPCGNPPLLWRPEGFRQISFHILCGKTSKFAGVHSTACARSCCKIRSSKMFECLNQKLPRTIVERSSGARSGMSERNRKRAFLGMVPCDVCVCASVRRVIHARRCVRGGHVVSARQSLLSAGLSLLLQCNQNDLYPNAGGARSALRGSTIGADSACMKSSSKPAVEMVISRFCVILLPKSRLTKASSTTLPFTMCVRARGREVRSGAHVGDAVFVNVTTHLPVVAPRSIDRDEGHQPRAREADGEGEGKARQIRRKVPH